MPTTFSSHSIYSDRFVWDPSVHQRLYGERCSYVLIRLQDPRLEIVEHLSSVLRKALIKSHCVYALYGYFDVLVRFWATGQKRDRFLKLLTMDGNIEAHEEFDATEIQYLWGQQQQSVSDLLKYRADITAACLSAAESRGIDSGVIDRLSVAQLIHKKEERPETAIKFYVALSKGPGSMESPTEGHDVARFFRENGELLGLMDISIYIGNGFARYLIKAVASSYPTVSRATKAIVDHVSRHRLRSMTLLIANDTAPECDIVDVEWDEFDINLLQLEGVLGSQYAESIAALTKLQRTEVGDRFGIYSALFFGDSGDLAQTVFIARLLNQYEALARALSVVVELEDLLRRFLLEVFQAELGRTEWFQTVKNAGGEAGLDMKKNPTKDYTLHDLLAATAKLVSGGKLRHTAIEGALGQKWKTRIEGLKEMRNDFAHGRLNEAYLTREWGAVATRLADVLEMRNTLRALFGNDSGAEAQNDVKAASDVKNP